MATALADLIPMLDRELNPLGAEQFQGISAAQRLGYLADGFWDAYLSGFMRKYTLVDGAELDPPRSGDYITDRATLTEDLPKQFHMLVVTVAGFRLLRLKILQLAVNFKAEAGPVSYEQQASATTLRAVLDSLTRRLDELKLLYSEEHAQGFFVLMDGQAQAEYAAIAGLAEQSVVL